METEGTAAIVTGAARRVGRAIALELARSGCDLTLHFNTSQGEAESLRNEIARLGSKCHLIQADLAKKKSWAEIVRQTIDELGRVDVLVNNASVFEPMTVAAFDVDRWDRCFRVNLTAAMGLCHHAAPYLARGGRGRIVNLADISGITPWPNHLHYCASKAALVNLTRALARALAPAITVNAVAPGIAEFPEYYEESLKAHLVAKVPLGRSGTPEDIARTVRFLCMEGDYITGQVICVDGGRSVT